MGNNLYFFLLFIGESSPSPMTISSTTLDGDTVMLPNEISAPYEVSQFPIEQIERKLQIQRQLNNK